VQTEAAPPGKPWAWFAVACGLALAITAGWDGVMREVPTAARPAVALSRWVGQADVADPVLLRAAVASPLAGTLGVVIEGAEVRGDQCPAGWRAAGEFKITRYVLAREVDFSDEEMVQDPCGLTGQYRAAFLAGTGVPMQGSGLTVDGTVVRTTGGGCFAESECALTATGTCATAGRTIAVDPTVLGLGSAVWIDGLGVRQAEDVGGLVEGRHIDVYEGAGVSVQAARDIGVSERLVCVAGK